MKLERVRIHCFPLHPKISPAAGPRGRKVEVNANQQAVISDALLV